MLCSQLSHCSRWEREWDEPEPPSNSDICFIQQNYEWECSHLMGIFQPSKVQPQQQRTRWCCRQLTSIAPWPRSFISPSSSSHQYQQFEGTKPSNIYPSPWPWWPNGVKHYVWFSISTILMPPRDFQQKISFTTHLGKLTTYSILRRIGMKFQSILVN